MYMLLRNLSLLFIIAFTQSVHAQNTWCGTDEYNQQLLQNLSSEEAVQVQARHYKIFQKSSQNSKSGTVYTIPVVVHVIHDNCEGNISKEQIESGIEVLNEDFRRMNSDTNKTRSLFKPFASDVEIRFELANIDPSGNCTEGIVRVNSELANNADNDVKALSFWSSSKYMNIWLVQSMIKSSSIRDIGVHLTLDPLGFLTMSEHMLSANSFRGRLSWLWIW